MGNPNSLEVSIPAETVQQIQQKLTEAYQLLQPFLISLTNEQRQASTKMGDKSIPFVQKILEYSKTNPGFTPAYMDTASMETDLKAVQTLTGLFRTVEQMNSGLDDTIMLCGSEAFTAALTYYNAVKYAARNNVPDAKVVYEDLKQRFPGRVRRSSDVVEE